MACLNIYILEAVKNTSEIFAFFEAIIPLVIIMPIGPLIYFYVKILLEPHFKISKKERRHFYPILLDFIPNIVTIVFIILGFLGFISSEKLSFLGDFVYTYNQFIDIPRWLSLAIYSSFTLKFITNDKIAFKNPAFKKWTKQFVVGFMLFSVIWLFHLVPYLTPKLSNSLLKNVGWYPIYIPLIILVYWLGINGYIISFKTYKKASKFSIISKDDIQLTIQSLEKLMRENKVFLNPTLQLKDVVAYTKIPQKTISAVLNQHLQKSFNEYVNGFRIEEFKKRLRSDNLEKLTITGIAFECGFNSQATFQRVFKANTNLSPSAFKKLHFKA